MITHGQARERAASSHVSTLDADRGFCGTPTKLDATYARSTCFFEFAKPRVVRGSRVPPMLEVEVGASG